MADVYGMVTGIGSSILNNFMAREREEEARLRSYQLNEQAAENADARTRALYDDLYSPRAKIQQLKEAGLSPSLMYESGAAGGTGTSGAEGAGAGSVSPTIFGINPLEIAQINKANAESDLAHEQANRLRGSNTMGAAEVENLTAETAKKLKEAGLIEASENLTKSQTILTDLKNQVASETMEFNINKANAEADRACTLAMQAVWESISAQKQAEFDAATIQARINTIELQNSLLNADNLLRKSQINLNDAERQRCGAEIDKWQKEICLGVGELQVKLQEANTKQEYNRIIEEFYNEQVNNLKNRLEFEKNKFSKENAREWTRTIGTIVNDFLGNVSKFIMATSMI